MLLKPSRGLFRTVSLGIWITVLGVGGAFLGVKLASRSSEPPAATRAVPSFLLASDARLPSAQLVGDDAVPRPTEDFLGHAGTVVLFLDPDCEPCKFVARQWQVLREQGMMDEVEILGISYADRERIDRYRGQLALEFPVISDLALIYATRFGVDTYPWEIVVDAEGRVVAYTGDVREMGSPETLAPLTGGS